MALSPEDKKDVKGAMGKALANKVENVTKDKYHVPGSTGRMHPLQKMLMAKESEKSGIPLHPRGHTPESWKETKETRATYDRDYKEGLKAEMAAKRAKKIRQGV